MAARALALVIAGALLAGGCAGAGSGAPPPTRGGPPRSPLSLPPGVPREASGPADGAAARTIRRWADALRRGQVERASSLWALPAKIQNATPVLTLRTRAEVRVFNDSLSCGAVLTGAAGARGGYTIATFRLTERPGGNGCGSGVGHRAQTAVLVRGGRIVAWYRLPEGEPGPVV